MIAWIDKCFSVYRLFSLWTHLWFFFKYRLRINIWQKIMHWMTANQEQWMYHSVACATFTCFIVGYIKVNDFSVFFVLSVLWWVHLSHSFTSFVQFMDVWSKLSQLTYVIRIWLCQDQITETILTSKSHLWFKISFNIPQIYGVVLLTTSA